ncbi:hypothetical protein RIR_jg32268.t1 [Rhizophagus irregularis DAOM 181602=DAOM 197198]|nr:hypothetical protein RIR_jg32268.t1 [Rhizophagus irregularis DAOM 181602=DAOM 197198]
MLYKVEKYQKQPVENFNDGSIQTKIGDFVISYSTPRIYSPSKELLSGNLLSQETAVVNTRVIKEFKNTANLI